VGTAFDSLEFFKLEEVEVSENMTEIDTLIAVMGSLSGILVGYFLSERQARTRLARETALRTLEDKQAALKRLWDSVADYVLAVSTTPRHKPEREKVIDAVLAVEESILRAIIWFPPETMSEAFDALYGLDQGVTKIAKGGSLSVKEFKPAFNSITAIVVEGLGVKVLADQFDKIVDALKAE